jgi:hypothetical protein
LRPLVPYKPANVRALCRAVLVFLDRWKVSAS